MEQKRQRDRKNTANETHFPILFPTVTTVSFSFLLCLKNNYETTKRRFFYPPEWETDTFAPDKLSLFTNLNYVLHGRHEKNVSATF